MKKYQIFGLSLAILILSVSSASATSLDEIYRDIVKSDNRGYLPLFVKNRTVPEFLDDQSLAKNAYTAPAFKEDESLRIISLENERRQKEELKALESIKWKRTVYSIKKGNITPVELQEIDKKIKQNDPQAIEIFAWMNARGVGVKQDLIQAFNLYQRAAKLKVPNASKNAALVYKSMKREQKESLTKANFYSSQTMLSKPVNEHN